MYVERNWDLPQSSCCRDAKVFGKPLNQATILNVRPERLAPGTKSARTFQILSYVIGLGFPITYEPARTLREIPKLTLARSNNLSCPI